MRAPKLSDMERRVLSSDSLHWNPKLRMFILSPSAWDFNYKTRAALHLNLLLCIFHLLAGDETWLPVTKCHFPHSPLLWCLVWFSLPTGQGAGSALCLLPTATSWSGCCPGGSLAPSFPSHFHPSLPEPHAGFLMTSMSLSRSQRSASA